MNDDQEDKLSMYYAVLGAMDRHEDAWQTVPAFVTGQALFAATVEAIERTARDQETGIPGATLDKSLSRQRLADAAWPLAAALQAHAHTVGDGQLAARVGYTRSDFTGGRDTEARVHALIVRHEVAPRLGALADFGVTGADLTRLDDALADYADHLTGPREAITDRKAATAGLRDHFAEADRLLRDRLDKLVPLIAARFPAFGTDWRHARTIYDTDGPPRPRPSASSQSSSSLASPGGSSSSPSPAPSSSSSPSASSTSSWSSPSAPPPASSSSSSPSVPPPPSSSSPSASSSSSWSSPPSSSSSSSSSSLPSHEPPYPLPSSSSGVV